MNSRRFKLVLAVLGLSAVPMGACSVESVDASESCGESPERAVVVIAPQQPVVRELQISIRHEDGSLEDLPITRWPVRTLDMIKIMPMSRLVLNERGYAVAFSSIDPPCEGVEYPPSGVALDDVEFDADGHLMKWSLLKEDYSPCPGAEDEPMLVVSADEASENDVIMTIRTEEEVVDTIDAGDEAIAPSVEGGEEAESLDPGEAVDPCDGEMDESRLFEDEVADIAESSGPLSTEESEDGASDPS